MHCQRRRFFVDYNAVVAHGQSAEELLKQGNSYWEQENYTQTALSWRKAAVQGYTIAQTKLGICYYLGAGVEESQTEAVKWTKRAAHQGDIGAIRFLNSILPGWENE